MGYVFITMFIVGSLIYFIFKGDEETPSKRCSYLETRIDELESRIEQLESKFEAPEYIEDYADIPTR